mmetsp:Transcript_9625/g.27670  ORF Transcript_9625/g.27670 Transcript_9625/m.27670 type:complete len:405 (-) Transcript_9625:1075-2289(-)
MSSVSNLSRTEDYNDSYKPLETVQIRAMEVADAGSGQHARVWGLPAGTLDPRSYDVFSRFCEGDRDAQPLPKTIREILQQAPSEGLGTFQYSEICKKMESNELLGALAGLAGVGMTLDANLVVKSLLPGCSAEQCGCINLGDVVVTIDGRQTKQSTEALGWLMGRQGSFTTIALERHELGLDGIQMKRSFEVELMRGGPDFISLMLRVYALENEAAELRATTISLRKSVDDPLHASRDPRRHEDSWNRPSQPDPKIQEDLTAAIARCGACVNILFRTLSNSVWQRSVALEGDLVRTREEKRALQGQLDEAGKATTALRANIGALQAQLAEADKAKEAMKQAEVEREQARLKDIEGLQLKLQAVNLKMTDLEQNTLPGLQRTNQALESKLLDAKRELQKKKGCCW